MTLSKTDAKRFAKTAKSIERITSYGNAPRTTVASDYQEMTSELKFNSLWMARQEGSTIIISGSSSRYVVNL